MSETISLALLAAACGFGAAVWLLTAHFNRRANAWHSFLYVLVGASYAAIGVLVTTKVIGRPVTPAPVLTILLLTVVFVIPPAIQLAAHLKARNMIDEQRNGHE